MKYKRIQEQLLSEIMTGAFNNGEDFPSENSLSQRFKVSRMTARRALSELEKDGYLTRIPGRGNILKSPTFSQGFFTVKPFREYAKSANMLAETRLICAQTRDLPKRGRTVFNTNKAIFVHRLRSLDGEVIQEEQRFLRADLCEDILQENLAETSIHDYLIHQLKLPLTRVWQSLNAITLDEEQATLMAASAGEAAFEMERITFTFEQPVTWVRYLMRGKHYQFENSFAPQQHVNPGESDAG